AERSRDTVLVWNAGSPLVVPCALALAVPGRVDFSALNIRLTADIIDRPDSFEGMTSQQALLDLDRTVGPLQVRFRQSGDRFHPLGAPGSKKLQDFFIDRRIPRAERPYVPLVVSQGAIVWVVGHRIAEPFKLRPETVQVLRLQCCPLEGLNAR